MIFVDDWNQHARIGRLNDTWCHLTVGPFDDLAELHELAQRIGLQRRWFQAKPWPRAHYDVTANKRLQALAAGAVPITWREAGRQMFRAVEAWKAASGGLPRTSTPEGKPPGCGDMWLDAMALYEIAMARAEAQP